MKLCLFIFALSLVSFVNGRGVKLGIDKAPIPLNGLSIENSNSFSWESCASEYSMATLNSLSVSIDGNVAALEVDVSLAEEVTGGTVNLTILYYGVTVYQKYESLCDILEEIGQSCPLSEGDYTENAEIDIPDYIPCSSFKGFLSVTDQIGDPLGCITFKLKMNC